MAPIAASLSALASSVSALSSTKLAMIPLAAGLAIGSAVGVTYSSSEAPAEPATATRGEPVPVVASPPVLVPTTKPAAATAKTETPCAAQTWPYIDAKCRVGQAAGSDRKVVRLVTAPRASDMPTEAQQSSDMARRENPGLISSGTVLHTPQPLAEEPKVTKRSVKRDSRARRVAEQTYQVPAEYGRGNARIVVRPMRIDPDR